MNTTDSFRAADTEVLNALLRNELSAVEAYTHAVGMFNDQLVIADLQKVRDDHSRAVRELRDQVVRAGGSPASEAGSWGTLAQTVGAAKAVSPATVLAALRQGEEHSVSEYEATLESDEVPVDGQCVIRSELLPACRRHVEELDHLLGGEHA